MSSHLLSTVAWEIRVQTALKGCVECFGSKPIDINLSAEARTLTLEYLHSRAICITTDQQHTISIVEFSRHKSHKLRRIYTVLDSAS